MLIVPDYFFEGERFPIIGSIKVTVGSGDYVIQQGDCVESIAYEHGFFWETIWDHPRNAELKQTRGNPNLLLPGDRLIIPERRVKQETGGTEQRHCFRARGVPSHFRVRVLRGGQPRAGEHYVLNVDGRLSEGQTDDEGVVEADIPPNAREAKLVVGEEGAVQEYYRFELGGMDPITELVGVQKRLINLGFACNKDGQMSNETRAAISAFQEARDLEPTGELDQETRDQIEQAHLS